MERRTNQLECCQARSQTFFIVISMPLRKRLRKTHRECNILCLLVLNLVIGRSDFVAHAAFLIQESTKLPSNTFGRGRKKWPTIKCFDVVSLSKDPQDTSMPSITNKSKDDSESTTNNPTKKLSRVETRLQEMQERNRKGEKLTQEYCDSVLSLCVASDEWDSVLDVMDVMKNHDLTQERSTYRACLQSCFEMGNGASAEEILKAMEMALVKPDPVDISLVVAAMCRNDKTERGWWRKALKLLQTTKSVSVSVEAYDAVISCMVEERKWKEAVRLLREMEQGSSSPKNEKNNKSSKTIRIHPKPALSTYREVVECCVAAYEAEQSVQVLLSMTKKGIKPTVYTFELVISALAKKGAWRRALQLLNTMDAMSIPQTIVTYNTVISTCAKAREVGMAKNLLSRMKKSGIRPNVITFNSLISACASTSRWRDALSLLSECSREPGASPDIYTYTNAMRACAKGGQTRQALTMLQVVKDKRLPIDTYCYTAAIEACAKANMWKKALDILAEMEKRGVEPSGVTYSVVISACGNGGQWGKALNLLEVMREKKMRINLITYNAAITALSKAAKKSAKQTLYAAHSTEKQHLSTRVMDLLDQMEQDGVTPDGFSFSSAISCCGAEGRWKEALEFIETMKKGGPRTRPNKISYTAAIAACGRSGEHEHALRLFRDMKDQGLAADRVAYNALFSALRVSGKKDTAYELWGEMCGIRSSNTSTSAKIATAKADARTTPDIITVTDVVAVLSRSEEREDIEKVDRIFTEAVARGIVFPADSLDSMWEVDLHGMSFPVARAACRYHLKKVLISSVESGNRLFALTFITGVGKPKSNSRTSGSKKSKAVTLRDYVQAVLLIDFDPPLESFIPERAQGMVEIKKEDLAKWIKKQVT